MAQIFPFLIFVLLVVAFTVLLRKWAKSIIITLIFAPLISVVLYQIIGYFIEGYLDPFFAIAAMVSYGIGFIICLATLFMMSILLKLQKQSWDSLFTKWWKKH